MTGNKRRPAGRKKTIWITLMFALLLGGGGAAWYFLGDAGVGFGQATAEPTPEFYTATARRGDLRLVATGSGTLVSGQSVDLSFSTSGTVSELNTWLGAPVKAGDVLAKITGLESLEASIAQAELSVLQAQQALSALHAGADVSLAQAYQTYVTAKESYAEALFSGQRTAYARCSQEANTQNRLRLERASEKLAGLTGSEYEGSDQWIDAKNDYDSAYANYTYCLGYTEAEKAEASANLALAEAALKKAENAYNTLKASAGIDPTELALTEAQLKDAEARRRLAQEDLAGASLIAPIDGTVTAIAAGVGEKANTDTFITIANMERLNVEVSLDETDLAFLKVGNRAEIVFDALPDRTFTGTVIQANPQLATDFGFSTASGVVALDADQLGELQTLPLGLSATVDLIADEAIDAVLAPVDALRDLGDGTYSVFVVGADGQPRLRVVEVGIIDVSYAEIVSGLEAGETITTGMLQTTN